jgi:hypothetical protein
METPISVLGCLGKGALGHPWVLPTLLIWANLQRVSILQDIITLKLQLSS